MLAGPSGAQALAPKGVSIGDAAGLVSGPVITDAGWVWDSPKEVMLSDAKGHSRVLAPVGAGSEDEAFDRAWFGGADWVLARPAGVFGGRIGGDLRELRSLRRCDPASPTAPPRGATYAVSTGQVFAALPKRCFPTAGTASGVVLDTDLRSGRSHVLARIPGTPEGLAASGRYLAFAYVSQPRSGEGEPRFVVRVLDAATGSVVNQVAAPAGANGYGSSVLQVDSGGDVLVTSGCGASSPGQLAHVAQPACVTTWWWARSRSRVGYETTLGDDAVLSDGRVAFVSRAAPAIDVTNLRAGTTRRVVTFSGTVRPAGLSLAGNRLVWAQQSAVVDVVRTPNTESCTSVPLSPVELASVDLADGRLLPAQMTGAPIPPQYSNEPECIESSERESPIPGGAGIGFSR
jgi:hypothetical protein